jgi:hypothetical protein
MIFKNGPQLLLKINYFVPFVFFLCWKRVDKVKFPSGPKLETYTVYIKILFCVEHDTISLVVAVVHTVGHIVNFYHVTTQPVEHLRCLTSEMSFPSDKQPGIDYWLFQTLTG